MPGITIGEGAIVGAMSVVTKNIPSNETFAGIPAKVLAVIKQMQKNYRYVNLDLLRGLASLGVLFGHASWLLGTNNSHYSSVSFANYSVAFFLSLSGFVIGYNYKPFKFCSKILFFGGSVEFILH